MKRNKLIEIEIVDYSVCDSCGRVINIMPSNAFDATIDIRFGYVTRDGGQGEKLEVDLCERCTKEILLPAIMKAIPNAKMTEWDW